MVYRLVVELILALLLFSKRILNRVCGVTNVRLTQSKHIPYTGKCDHVIQDTRNHSQARQLLGSRFANIWSS